jgi:hypothetical protein
MSDDSVGWNCDRYGGIIAMNYYMVILRSFWPADDEASLLQ